MRGYGIFFLLILGVASVYADEGFDTDRLPIGDPARKYDFSAVYLDSIFDTKAGRNVSFDAMIQDLQQYRIIMAGETHTNHLTHEMQLDVIRGLVAAGKKVVLALEMFTPEQNAALSRWVEGKLTEDEFMEQADYFKTWGHNYRYYQPIFQYVKEQHIPMYGVNTQREYASKIGMKGLAGLSETDRSMLPEIDTSNVEHRYFFNVAMEGMGATSPAQFRNIYAAQSLWDTAMGEGAIKVAREHPDAIVVVLVGSGHVVYNLGIGRILSGRSDLPFASIVVVDVPDSVKESVMMKVKKSVKKQKRAERNESAKPKNDTKMPADRQVPKPDRAPAHKMPSMSMMHGMEQQTTPYRIVSRSLADYLWGKPELKTEKYPAFGFSIGDKTDQGFPIKRVIPETIAAKQGLQRKDIIITIDGRSFVSSDELKKYLHFKNWGDTITFQLFRDDAEMTVSFLIEPDESNKNK